MLALTLALTSCVRDVIDLPGIVETAPEGQKVELSFKIAVPNNGPSTRALADEPEIDNVVIAVSGGSGFFNEWVVATIESADETPVVTEFTNTNVIRLLLPQTLTVNDTTDPTDLLTAHQHVAVKYTVRTWYHSNATPVDEEVTTTALLKNVTVPSWTPNMSVVYNITINPYSDNPITFDPAVVDWEAVVSSPVTVGE